MSGGAAPRELLAALFAAGVARVAGDACVRAALEREGGALRIAGRPLPEHARLVVIAAGKAAAAMARGLEERAGDRIAGGLAVTKDGHGQPLARLRLCEAGHPVPDARSEAAGREALRLAAATGPDDVLLVLLSGGASALLSAPLPGLSRDELAATTRALLAAGVDIAALNAVRRHLTAVSGGRLARAAGAGRIEVLAISDVAGDDPAVIGSGPCAPDPSRFRDALQVVAGRPGVPERVRRHLEAGAAGKGEESVAPDDPLWARVRNVVLASLADALDAVEAAARQRGIPVERVAPELVGEARDAGSRLAARARALRGGEARLLVAGGETTVTVRGDGRGGRSQELALAAALALDGVEGVTLLAAGTDGSDGPTEAAGAFADGGTLARARAQGLDARDALARNDAHGFFAAEGGLFVTGPTATNVRDLVLVHVAPTAA